MAVTTPAAEKAAREALKIKAQKPGVLGPEFPVFISRLFVHTEAELVNAISKLTGGNRKTKYLQIELVGLDDVDGEDNCTILEATYRFHLFVLFNPKNADGDDFDNSTDEFNAAYILLRNEFTFAGNLIPDQNIASDALERENFILIDEDPYTGFFGHFVDLLLTVQF